MVARKLEQLLDQKNINYQKIKHQPAYTAQEIAAYAHVSGKELLKTVIVKIDGKLAMVVEPSNIKVDLNALKEFVGAKKVELAGEKEFESKFPECELGAMPPTGDLYNMEVYADSSIKEDKKIAFNAGDHSELITMSGEDFIKLVHPKWFESWH